MATVKDIVTPNLTFSSSIFQYMTRKGAFALGSYPNQHLVGVPQELNVPLGPVGTLKWCNSADSDII